MKAGVRVENRQRCILCKSPGKLLYQKLFDQLFSAPGEWNISICPRCKLLWPNPSPCAADLHKLYNTYYTHQAPSSGPFRKILELLEFDVLRSMGYKGTMKGLCIGNYIPYFKEYTRMNILNVKPNWGERLLDVGAGSGIFLSKMRSLGWQVAGVEFDPAAAKFAVDNYNLEMHVGDLESTTVGHNSVDVITLNHVLEHVDDPKKLFLRCYEILRPGGRIVVLTPNSESLGHKMFHKNWRGLEVPRHLNIFSVTNIEHLVYRTEFKVEKLTTSARIARYLYSTSVHIKEGRRLIGAGGNRGYWLALKSYGFQILEEIVKVFNKKAGEEIFFIGIK